ncbi:TSUP family transporter [Marinomonas sp. 15G1-11]|uniref:Probable membrane transporter protein n=1 Tax=Marinomonas phaeophyticola TaxID=3004091 RepID=A0ABT4JWD3_9GAMM|nr:TSUP family transporter [Marinomonas sp. 15G1-11]MCZ2721874.1 TSUP family transporter [Marinomonas sp. 15G1-11]
MEELLWWQYGLIALIFVWSGFVRSGLGFGGAALALPFLLLVLNEPLIFLPLVAVQLLIFSSWIAFQGYRKNRKQKDNTESNIDWRYLKYALSIIIVPKMIGILGLLTLPSDIMTAIIFFIVSIYAISYILNKPFKSDKPYLDILFLIIGGYFSGASLIGAPLIVAVFATKVAKHQLRDTLFILWFILVVIKMTSFLITGIDLQLIHHLWLLPCAFIGHLMGQAFHEKIQKAETPVFFRVLGVSLLFICIVGIYSTFQA